jgi:secernin
MCDSMICKDRNSFIFAKNSDRDPTEVQIIQYVKGDEGLSSKTQLENLSKYEKHQWPKLLKVAAKFENKYKALISRPIWIWGAEMGVNEKGLTIGNEALFSKQKCEKEGLLGMDILRLTLHNCATTKEALSFIGSLLEEYGQGGNGSYSGSLYYQNGFLISDGKTAAILESSGRNYLIKSVKDVATISNAYSIRDSYDGGNIKPLDFKKEYESKLFTFFTKGDWRQATTERLIKEGGCSWQTMAKTLRYNTGTIDKLNKTMKSICLDTKGIATSRTTNSMIVEYTDQKPLVWFTATSFPIFSAFIPFGVTEEDFKQSKFNDINFSYSFAKEKYELTEKIVKATKEQKEKIVEKAYQLENSFRDQLKEDSNFTAKILEDEISYRKEIEQILAE